VVACPHFLSFFCPVSALKQDVPYGLRSIAALAFVGIRFVDGVEVCAEADLAAAHLRDHGADGSVHPAMQVQCRFPWFDPKLEELSSVLGCLPGNLPLDSHRFPDVGFGGRHESSKGSWSLPVTRRLSGVFGCLIGCLVTRYANMGRDLSELHVPSCGSKLVEFLYCLRKDILAGWVLGISHRQEP